MGAVVSCTVTTKVVGALALPAASVAVQVTVVAPGGKSEPLGGTHATVGAGSAASEAVGSGKLTVVPLGALCSTVRSGAAPRVGAIVSWTVTVNWTWELFPALSVAVQVTVVAPGGKSVPGAGTQVTTGFGSTPSLAVGGA